MKSGERKAAIIAAAVDLFAEKGFRGATTRELASALGVTEPVLYQHYATKSDLYSAIIAAKTEQGMEIEQAFREQLQRDDDRGFLTFLGEMVLSRYEDDPSFIRLLLFSALERHELSDRFFESHVQAFHETVAGYIRRRIDAGAFRQVDPQVAAHSFLGMIAYEGLGMVLFPDRPRIADRRTVVDQMVSLFLNGILRQVPAEGIP